MGNGRSRRGWVGRAALAPLAVALLLGCASRSKSAPAPSAAPAAAARAEQAAPAQITSLQAREAAPGVRLELQATAPLVWTQYRDSEGRLVLELPNSTMAPGVADLGPEGGLLRSVSVRQVDSGERPLTRLVIATEGETEHNLVSNGNGLLLTLVPAGSGAATMAEASEPVPVAPIAAAPPPAAAPPAPVAPAPAPSRPMETTAAVPSPAGTPESPYVAPAPAGVAATRLEDVVVESGPRGPQVRIQGDGDFAYSTFQLADPARFVIDLQGVTNAAPRATVPGTGDPLARVRIAQFKSQPAVSRVVLDLSADVVPHLQSTGAGLVVSFDGSAARLGASEEPVAPPTPAAEPAAVAGTSPPATWAEPAAAAPAPSAPAPVEMAATPPAPAPAAPPAAVPAPRVEITGRGTEVAATPAAAAPPRPPAGVEPSDVGSVEAVEVQDVVPTTPAQTVATPSPNFAARELGTGKKVYVGEPINFSLRDADIKEVLRTFAKIAGLNMVIQPGVSGPVTVELDQVPWDQALEIILKTNDLWYELDGNIMRIAPRSKLNEEAQAEAAQHAAAALAVPLRTVLKRISYAQAQEIASLLRSGSASILSARGSVVVDARTNTLIIKELPEFMNTVLDVIDQVDVPEPQVMIEARIVETTKQYNRTLGVAWNFDGIADAAHGNTTGLVFPNNASGRGEVNLLTGGNNGFLHLNLGNVLNTFNLDATLQAAENEGLVNILSAPKVATLNNVAASIQSGLQIPVQTVANNTVTVQFINATLRLDVTPHVTSDGTVLMDIAVQKREPQLAFAIQGATNAPIATKEARTRVIVRDGGTTVIGGIYKVTSDQGQDRVPGLADIPILGHLFRNRRRSNANEELLIFITPRVIKL
ncbi:MAG TPA: type IV pilus secretin PilQ [Thermoanaerobaculia bacterium]|jgi:type IV pilus assembly protein PilQ|nr:type IV pilus secretin PilQ [Thermoanaerobaculia bacterium]